ncbi:hypothetical protein U0070_001461 [Myodes glareolus]|uniref:Uncharacterized protein n=1 Tax=Myodes glareolus TaxID=447135 RepID=A0AAW0HCF3_MYOGA
MALRSCLPPSGRSPEKRLFEWKAGKMAESSEGDIGKPVASGAPKTEGRRVPGRRVVESRYLQSGKKTKKASVSAGGTSPERRKTSTLQIKDTSMFRTAPQPAMTKSKKAESTSFATRKKAPLPKKKQDLQETMDMMES